MNSRISRTLSLLLLCVLLVVPQGLSAKKRPPAGGRIAIVVDERLSALRGTPEFSGALLRRMSRGGLVAITGTRNSRDGIVFYRVNVTRRTSGWIQRDAVVSPTRAGDDARLLRLIKASEDFDRIARARIFLDYFRLSELRPEALLIYAFAAEESAAHLSRDASRRLDAGEMNAGGAPVFSYFLNYNGLDRYRRLGVVFDFDPASQRYRYDGAAWREILRRHPHAPEAAEARKRLELR